MRQPVVGHRGGGGRERDRRRRLGDRQRGGCRRRVVVRITREAGDDRVLAGRDGRGGRSVVGDRGRHQGRAAIVAGGRHRRTRQARERERTARDRHRRRRLADLQRDGDRAARVVGIGRPECRTERGQAGAGHGVGRRRVGERAGHVRGRIELRRTQWRPVGNRSRCRPRHLRAAGVDEDTARHVGRVGVYVVAGEVAPEAVEVGSGRDVVRGVPSGHAGGSVTAIVCA